MIILSSFYVLCAFFDISPSLDIMRNGPCCTEKAVLVTVFVERPRRRVPANHHHRQPLLHHPITQTIIRNRGGGGKGYDRKAELLRYSQGLRESARSTSSTPRHTPAHVSHNQQPKTKIVAVQVTRYSRPTTCMGSWKNLIPNFLKSSKSSQGSKEREKIKKNQRGSTTSNKMNTIVKSFQTHKKSGFFSKLISTYQKRK